MFEIMQIRAVQEYANFSDLALHLYEWKSWGRTLGRNPDKSLKAFPPCYLKSPQQLCLEIIISSNSHNLLQFLHSPTALIFIQSILLQCLKVHKHEIFFLTFFAETETIWSQGPVPRDFKKSCSNWQRYSTFKQFRACSAWDEIGS
jgi:hypothetical protein